MRSRARRKRCSPPSTRVIAEDGEIEFDDATRDEWAERIEHLGHHGLRVLACAMKTRRPKPTPTPYEELTFLGLIGLEDPARADVPQAIQRLPHAPASASSW